jgi:hypothetical protein
MRHCNGVSGGSAVSEERWFKQQRMDWIAETLRIFGFINREHIKRKFGLSTPQASIDMNNFQKLYPGITRYDVKTKRYVLTETKI